MDHCPLRLGRCVAAACAVGGAPTMTLACNESAARIDELNVFCGC